MSIEQAEWGVQSLYENPSVRDELTDMEAETLLRWGEAQIRRLAALDLDDAAFESAYDSLSGLIRRMNRLAARRAYLLPDEVEIALNRIAEYAARVGLLIPPEQIDAYLQQPAAPNNHENLHILIDLVMSGQQPAS